MWEGEEETIVEVKTKAISEYRRLQMLSGSAAEAATVRQEEWVSQPLQFFISTTFNL